jgi:hypothetical protein
LVNLVMSNNEIGVIRIIKGRVSIIVILKNPACNEFYDIDGTVLGVNIPSKIRNLLLHIIHRLPHRVAIILEQIIIPLKARIDRPFLHPSTGCFLTARTTRTLAVTVEELARHFSNVHIIVFRRPDIKIDDYYKLVPADLVPLGIKPHIVILG